MDTVVFAGYTVKDLLIYSGALLALLIVLGKLKALLASNKEDKYSQTVQCRNCGWRGRVSVYAGRCPQCNLPLGERRARKY